MAGKRLSRLLMAGLVATSGVLIAAAPAHASVLGTSLPKGSSLYRGDQIQNKVSGKSYYSVLIMQTDGNLVFKRSNGSVCWGRATNPNGYRATYQSDGNFVVYDGSGKALWGSNTVGVSGSSVSINTAGQLYIGSKYYSTCA